jgi:hypothetical protein
VSDAPAWTVWQREFALKRSMQVVETCWKFKSGTVEISARSPLLRCRSPAMLETTSQKKNQYSLLLSTCFIDARSIDLHDAQQENISFFILFSFA